MGWVLGVVYKQARRSYSIRPQELCESRGGRPGLPVPNTPDGFCGRKATLNYTAAHFTGNRDAVFESCFGRPLLIWAVAVVCLSLTCRRQQWCLTPRWVLYINKRGGAGRGGGGGEAELATYQKSQGFLSEWKNSRSIHSYRQAGMGEKGELDTYSEIVRGFPPRMEKQHT